MSQRASQFVPDHTAMEGWKKRLLDNCAITMPIWSFRRVSITSQYINNFPLKICLSPGIVCLIDLWMFPSSNFLCVYKCIYTHSLAGGGGVYGLNLGNASTRLPFPPEPLSTAYSHPVWGSLDTFTVFWKLDNIFWNAISLLLLSILDLGDNISLGQSIFC